MTKLREREFKNYRIRGNLLTVLNKKIVLQEIVGKRKQTTLNAFSDDIKPKEFLVRRIFDFEKTYHKGEVMEKNHSIIQESTFEDKDKAKKFFETESEISEIMEENKLAEGMRYLWKFEINDKGVKRISKNTIFDRKVVELSV